ncbi:MAG TPA: thymidine phosphorylase [Trebonia sp.]|nr:thymidine phosphorylase [Trebonia sp.]
MSERPRFDGVGVIRAKRAGSALTARQINDLMRAYMSGEFAEEQMSALLMAIFWQGMTPAETAEWTGAMIASGERADLSGLGRPAVDKHSTGGVGDKLSLIIVPLVAVFGAAVPQMSGRGLGHTGGTLDKLESIPGWRPDLDRADLLRVLAEVGGVITAAGDEMAPADRRLYALRDITATVESIPLIASSIMSKKVAEGTQSLLLDIKVGNGAFMRDVDRARLLGATMIEIGEAHGVRTAAMLTAMDAPLGRAVGNAVEVAEACEVLAGGGPDDVRELAVAEAAAMLRLAGVDGEPAAALADGRALAKLREMIRAQGGDPDQPLPASPVLGVVPAPRDGIVRRLGAYAVGMASWRLGAGRSRPGEAVSAAAGVICRAKPGEPVSAGQPVLELCGNDPGRLDAALAELNGALDIGDEPPAAGPLILERINC